MSSPCVLQTFHIIGVVSFPGRMHGAYRTMPLRCQHLLCVSLLGRCPTMPFSWSPSTRTSPHFVPPSLPFADTRRTTVVLNTELASYQYTDVQRFSCPRENRQLAVSLADLMIKWEAHGRERVRLRRAANATCVTPAPAAAGDPTKGTKRSLEGGTNQPATAGNGAAVSDGVAAAAASPATPGQQQGREKVMKTATGAAPGAGAGAVLPAREGSSAAGGGGAAEGTTDSYRLSKSAVRQGKVHSLCFWEFPVVREACYCHDWCLRGGRKRGCFLIAKSVLSVLT